MSAPGVSEQWPEEKIQRLRAAWGEGWSCYQIGVRMGISKNAVVGKVHRLGLEPRPSPIKRGDGTPRPRKSCAKRAPAVTLDALVCLTPKLEPEVAAMRETRQPKPVVVQRPPPQRTCEWLSGGHDKRTWKRCSEAAEFSRPYCEKHCRLAYLGYVPRRLAA